MVSDYPHTRKTVYSGFESRLAHPFFVSSSFLLSFLHSFLPVVVVTLVVTTGWLMQVETTIEVITLQLTLSLCRRG